MVSLTHELAAFALRTRFEDLPDSAVQAAKRSIMDALGVALAAGKLAES
jgi:2-methylcitrate dehydratase PrpD